jgi:hypothetical protein
MTHTKKLVSILLFELIDAARKEIWQNAKTGIRTEPTFICFLCVRKRVINRHGGAYCPKSLFIYARSASAAVGTAL